MNTLDILRSSAQHIAPELTVSDTVLQRADQILAESVREHAPLALRKAILDSLDIKRTPRRISTRKNQLRASSQSQPTAQ